MPFDAGELGFTSCRKDGFRALVALATFHWYRETHVTKRLLHVNHYNVMSVTFSELLARLISERGWKAVDLARASGLSHVAVGNYLKGRKPNYEAAEKIASVFGVNPDYLLNPSKYNSPLKLAAKIASAAPEKSRQDVFDAASRVLSESAINQGHGDTPGSGSGIIDWKHRAIAAERKLADLKAILKSTAETIIVPEP